MVRRTQNTGGDVHAVALRMLGRRALSKRELDERLRRRGFAEAIVKRELERLQSAGLIDDGVLAEAVSAGTLARGRGRRGLAAELRRRRIGREVAERALGAITEEQTEAALAAAFERACHKYPEWCALGNERRKMVRYLLARGFGLEQVRRVLAASQQGEGSRAEAVQQADPQDVS